MFNFCHNSTPFIIYSPIHSSVKTRKQEVGYKIHVKCNWIITLWINTNLNVSCHGKYDSQLLHLFQWNNVWQILQIADMSLSLWKYLFLLKRLIKIKSFKIIQFTCTMNWIHKMVYNKLYFFVEGNTKESNFCFWSQ